ncbi:hypothetical protein ACHAW6_012713 [Cyclotella cf. meneghiniana]
MMLLLAIVSVAMLSSRESALAFSSAFGSNSRHSAMVGRPANRASRTVVASSSRETNVPLPPLSIAILGGGIAGLSCATHLLRQTNDSNNNRNVRITLFDTGRLRPGGRCASRLPNDSPAVVKNRSSGAGNSNVRRVCDDEHHDNRSESRSVPESMISSLLRHQQSLSASAASRDRILTTMGPVDHAAQILSIPDNIPSLVDESDEACFQRQIIKWTQDQVIDTFPEGSVCELSSLDRTHETTSNSCKAHLRPVQGQMYYGKGGMSSIPIAMRDHCLSFNNSHQHSLTSFHIMQDVWVSPSNGVKYIGDSHNDDDDNNNNNEHYRWELRAGHKSLGKYHRLIIAHNGKCADRIMSNTPAKEFHSLLRTKFAPNVPHWGGNEMTLNSIYSLVFAIQCPKPETNNHESAVHASHDSPIVNALNKLSQSSNDTPSSQQPANDIYTVIIKNEPNLRLLSSNTLKHHHLQNQNSQSNIEVYTLLSSPQFGRKYKGPQENLPLDLMETVATEMLQSLENALNIERGGVMRRVIDLKLQLWGAAVPMNTWKSGKRDHEGFVYDARYGVGACGDWILDASIAGAWASGRRLADWISKEQHHRQQQRMGEENEDDGHEIKNWSVGLPNLESENASHSGGKFVPSRAALESGIGTIPSIAPEETGASIAPVSSGEFPKYNTHDAKKSFDSRGPSRNAGRSGSGSSRRQYSAGNNYRGRNDAATNSGGKGRNTPNGGGKSQPVTR